MMVLRFCLGVLALPLPLFAAFAQSQDTVVLRVTSPRMSEIAFSGVVAFGDGSERTFENVRTPFEVRLPRQDLTARFTAADGRSLAGEIRTFRDGKPSGHASGISYVGAVNLYFDHHQGFGFGSPRKRSSR